MNSPTSTRLIDMSVGSLVGALLSIVVLTVGLLTASDPVYVRIGSNTILSTTGMDPARAPVSYPDGSIPNTPSLSPTYAEPHMGTVPNDTFTETVTTSTFYPDYQCALTDAVKNYMRDVGAWRLERLTQDGDKTVAWLVNAPAKPERNTMYQALCVEVEAEFVVPVLVRYDPAKNKLVTAD